MQYLIKNQHWNIAEDYNKEKLLFALVDRFDHIENDSFYVWCDNHTSLDHRDYDLPSLVYIEENNLHWHVKGIPYRQNNEDPVIIWFDGMKEWWKNGEQYKISYPKDKV